MYKLLKDELDKKFSEELKNWRSIEQSRPNWLQTEDWKNQNCFSAEDIVARHYEYDLAKLKEKYGRSLGKTEKYYWIGINPYKLNEQIPMKELQEKMRNFTQRTWCSNVIYNIEAHTDKGYRVHCHMLVISNVKRHRIIEQLSKYLKTEPNFIDVNQYNYGYNERIQYIKGIKTDKKMENVQKDKEQRIEEEILDYYTTIENI
jgi:hypothetical protein